jgi:predicted dehydrogenase
MKKIKIAVVGVGHLGAIHTKVYSTLKNVELVGVCDKNPEKLSEFTTRYNIEGFTNVNQMLDRVDAVSIAVPTIYHYETAKPFLEKGIAVLLEKPMAATLQEAKKILNIAKKNNAILQIGHIERFNPAIQSIRKITIDPRFIECHRLAPYNPRGTDVSVVLDLMIHDLDIVLTFIDSKIKRIDAIGTPVLSKQEDIANVRIVFENKAVANLTSSRISFQSMRKIRIFQHNAYISIDYVEQSATLYKKVKNRIQQIGIPIQKEQPLQKEIVSFINCVRNKTQPIVSGEQGFRALQTAFKIIRKIRNG